MPPTSPWWRHQMEAYCALLALRVGNSPVTGEFPAQVPVTRGFDAFFDLRLNKRLSKQSLGWWYETPSGLLWLQCTAVVIIMTASSNVSISRVTSALWVEPINHRLLPLTKPSDVELWYFRWCAPVQTFWQAVEMAVIESPWPWFWRHCNVLVIKCSGIRSLNGLCTIN